LSVVGAGCKQVSFVALSVGLVVAFVLTMYGCNKQTQAKLKKKQEQAKKAGVPPRAQPLIIWWAADEPQPRAGGAQTAKLPASVEKKSLETIARTPPPRPKKGCDIAGVQRTVRPHLDSIRKCYRKALHKNPKLKGRLHVEIQVDKSGSARFLGVLRDTLGDTKVTRCIFKVLKPLAYPIPRTNKCVVIYPFNFSAGPGKPSPSK
jgi:hypothetical protein